jgi:hypothetical protein
MVGIAIAKQCSDATGSAFGACVDPIVRAIVKKATVETFANLTGILPDGDLMPLLVFELTPGVLVKASTLP